MKKRLLLIVLGALIISLFFVVAEGNEYPQITNQTCDALSNCSGDLECYSFPEIGLRCSEPNPCEWYECGEDKKCRIAESYPGQIECEIKDEEEFCGTSTMGYCETNEDCVTGGCSGQVCGNSTESMTTTCEWLDCYSDEKYNMECVCVNNKCGWTERHGGGPLYKCGDEICQGWELTETHPGYCPEDCVGKKEKKLKPGANETECPENCTCMGAVTKCEIEGGREMTVLAGESGNIIVQIKGINMSTNVTLYHHNGKVYGNFKGNETKELKVLPDQAKDKVEEVEPDIEEEEIVLDENALYQINAKKKARLFWIFAVKEKVRTQVSSETGEVGKIKTPWWGFLAKDIKEKID